MNLASTKNLANTMLSISKLTLSLASALIIAPALDAQSAQPTPNRPPTLLLSLGEAVQSAQSHRECRTETQAHTGWLLYTCVAKGQGIDSLQIVQQTPLDSAGLTYIREAADSNSAAQLVERALLWALKNSGRVIKCEADSVPNSIIRTNLFILPELNGLIISSSHADKGATVVVTAVQPVFEESFKLCKGYTPTTPNLPNTRRGLDNAFSRE